MRPPALALTLTCALLCACKPVRVYTLAGALGDPQALFEPLIACADAGQLEHRLQPDALHVEVMPKIWTHFTPRRSSFTAVIHVEDGSRGGDLEGRFAAAKRRSEALFACARNPPPPPRVEQDGVPVLTPEAADAAALAPAGE